MSRLQHQWEEHRRPLSEHLTHLSLQLDNSKVRVVITTHTLSIVLFPSRLYCISLSSFLLMSVSFSLSHQTKREESVAELSSLRDKMRAMVQDAARKETALAQLKAQVERMNKDINRYMYSILFTYL